MRKIIKSIMPIWYKRFDTMNENIILFLAPLTLASFSAGFVYLEGLSKTPWYLNYLVCIILYVAFWGLFRLALWIMDQYHA